MPKKIKKLQLGFTLIELLVVISIIGFIAAASFILFDNARKSARDALRMANLKQITKALDIYLDKYQTWPANQPADGCAAGWDDGYCNTDETDGFIQPLVSEGIFSKTPGDPFFHGNNAFKYYRYNAGTNGCDVSRGLYYVLGITNLETDSRPPQKFSGSGFACPSRDWQNDFDYVVGKFVTD